MNIEERIINAIENGVQLGKRYSFSGDDKIKWSSIGLQKYKGKYKVYIDEIEEEKMSSEEYSRESCENFDTLNRAFNYIEKTTRISYSELSSCKGQKIFNPEFF